MRQTLWLTAAVLVAAEAALGYGTVVGSFVSPGAYPDGLAPTTASPGIIWVNCAGPDRRYRCTETGSIWAWWNAPGGSAGALGSGVIGTGHYLWSINPSDGYCYRVDEGSGVISASFSVGTDEFGAAYGAPGGYLYTTRGVGNRLFRRNPATGSVIDSYSLSFPPNDLGYDSRGYLWIASAQRNCVYQTTLSGSIIDSFGVAVGVPYSADFDGTYVWVGVVGAIHLVYRYEVNPLVSATPASWGRIKAVFR